MRECAIRSKLKFSVSLRMSSVADQVHTTFYQNGAASSKSMDVNKRLREEEVFQKEDSKRRKVLYVSLTVRDILIGPKLTLLECRRSILSPGHAACGREN